MNKKLINAASKIQNINSKIHDVSHGHIGVDFDTSTKLIFGGFLFEQMEMNSEDWHYYSKAWHRAHGPKRSTSDRKITIYKYNGRAGGKLQEVEAVEFDGWRGNLLLQTIKRSNLFVAPQSKMPLSIRLDKFYDASLVRSIGHIKIYARTLLEQHVDFCAVLNGITFHANTIRAAVRGVHVKIKALVKKRNSPINLWLCRELGFCDAGIKQFCNVFSIDINSDYTPSEIETIVKANLAKAAPFESELRTVAKTLSYAAFI